MTKITLFFCLTVLATASTQGAYARGGLTEGGGRAVICKDGQGNITLAKSLDLYEGEQIRGFQFDSDLINGDEWTTAQNVVNRIAQWDQVRAESYLAELSSFQTEARFLPNAGLALVDDSNSAILAPGCELAQAAVQRIPQFPNDPRYLIDNSIWKVLGTEDRAALVLHEIIYREARSLGQTDSMNARYYNSALSSTSATQFQAVDYQAILSAIGFPYDFYISSTGYQFLLVQSEGLLNTIGDDGADPYGACKSRGMTLFDTTKLPVQIVNEIFNSNFSDNVANEVGPEKSIIVVYRDGCTNGSSCDGDRDFYNFKTWQASGTPSNADIWWAICQKQVSSP